MVLNCAVVTYTMMTADLGLPVSREIFAPVRKSPIAKGGDYFIHAEHEQFAPQQFIRRL